MRQVAIIGSECHTEIQRKINIPWLATSNQLMRGTPVNSVTLEVHDTGPSKHTPASRGGDPSGEASQLDRVWARQRHPGGSQQQCTGQQASWQQHTQAGQQDVNTLRH